VTVAGVLVDWLNGHPAADGSTVVGWRLDVAESTTLRAGIRDSLLGGPYEGPGLAARLGGSLDLHWSDGRLTRVGADRRAILDPAAALAVWRAAAVAERHGRLPPLAGPTSLPAVQALDSALRRAVSEDPARLLGLLRRLLEGCRAVETARADAVLRASHAERTVATSRGFLAAWHETACTIDLWADEVAGASFGRRALPTDQDLDRLVAEVALLARRLRVPEELPSGARGVLFMPAVVEALVGRLLLPNLSGRSIRDGRSAYTRTDLDARRQVIRPDLDLIVDTTLPLELATAPCSSDGVPAGRVALIAGGRLVSPIVDFESADDIGLPPTPRPRGRPTMVLQSTSPAIDVDAAVAELGAGVVVRDLPGLHTQQARRGSYALVTPDAQAVVAGSPGGRCSVRLAGNLVDHLAHPRTRLVRVPGELGVGLLVLSGVELLPA
jgi:predicted Zn-dependent protease